MSDGPTVLLTGLPRSGTTLACGLLNELPHVVALDEPGIAIRMNYQNLRDEGIQEAIRTIASEERRSIIVNRRAHSKHVRGQIGANHYADRLNAQGRRRSVSQRSMVRIDKPLAPDFLLVLKSPAPFSARLDAFSAAYPTYAIVRNPLATLSSWNSLVTEFHGAWANAVARRDSSLATQLDQAKDDVDRQIAVLGWFFGQYIALLPEDRIIRYEDIISSGGKALSVIVASAASLSSPLTSKNTNPLYDRAAMQAIGERLINSDGPYWELYSREEVRNLLEEALSQPPAPAVSAESPAQPPKKPKARGRGGRRRSMPAPAVEPIHPVADS